MILKILLTLFMISCNAESRGMGSVFKGEEVQQVAPSTDSDRDTTEKDTKGKDSSSNSSTSSSSKAGASGVFGPRLDEPDDNSAMNNSKASSVFIGKANKASKEAKENKDDKEVIEVKEDDLKEDYSGKEFLWPVETGQVSSFYGWRSSKRFHDGIDISAPKGTKVFAAKDGKVVYSGNKISGYGNMIVLKHESKIYSVYAHNSVNKVSNDDVVKKGDVIALVGKTGRARGPHLHFEIRKEKYSVDPLKYFTYSDKRKYGFVHEFK
ncbi:MAG: M23 family metallopeptidase [bacterium]